MKILQVGDVPYWAIGALTQAIEKYNPHLKIETIYIHPREVNLHLDEFREKIKNADIVSFTYWRTGSQLIQAVPEVCNKKIILTHHNEKNLLSERWDFADRIVVPTKLAYYRLKNEYGAKVVYIPYGVDLEKYHYNDFYPPKKIRIGYVGRIVEWKRLRPLALACKELGYKLLVLGKHDDLKYWDSIDKTAIEWVTDVPDNEMWNLYKRMTVFVNNSRDGRETGTQPLLEAWACGVPVLTTATGMARDLGENEKNCVLLDFNNPEPENNHEEENYEDIKKKLKMLIGNRELRQKIRENGWETIKNYPIQKWALEHEKLFWETLFGEEPVKNVADMLKTNEYSVSVIISTYNRKDNILKILDALEAQTYKNLEAIICDDNSNDDTISAIYAWRENHSLAVKYLNTHHEGYNLAMARNLGIIASRGQYLMFCDSRFKPKEDAVQIFLEAILQYTENEKVWLWGNKGKGSRRAFVENFSFVKKQHLIDAGMFCERITEYGGMSQEIRTRIKRQDFNVGYIKEAYAEQLSHSHKDWHKRLSIAKMKFLLYQLKLFES